MRRIMSTFDEYRSKETSKHTSRTMEENALQGFFNGACPPFGYQAIHTDILGSRGRTRKKLAINEAETGIVRLAYDLYQNGLEGQQLDSKAHINRPPEEWIKPASHPSWMRPPSSV